MTDLRFYEDVYKKKININIFLFINQFLLYIPS